MSAPVGRSRPGDVDAGRGTTERPRARLRRREVIAGPAGAAAPAVAPVVASAPTAESTRVPAAGEPRAIPTRDAADTPHTRRATRGAADARRPPPAADGAADARPARRKRAAPRRQPPDEFGLDPEFRERAKPLFRLLYDRYWRVETRGTRNVPRSGPVILVANHSGALPFDATMIACALDAAAHPRPTRFLYDRFVDHLPWIPQFYRRAGAVVATHENASRLLANGQLIGLFPEGVNGLAKLYSERYVLQPFSSGFVRLALRHGAPVVPVAVVGAEEMYPLIARAQGIGKLLGVPYLPITPFFPLLGPLGMIPLPTKWMIRFGKPLVLELPAGGRSDGLAIRALADRVRGRVQHMVRALLRERQSVF